MDIIDDIQARLTKTLPDFDSGKILAAVRKDWGGDAVYIRSVRSDIHAAIRSDTAPVRELARRYGLHPASVARIRRRAI